MNAAHTLHEITGEITKCKELAGKLMVERGTHLSTIARLEHSDAVLDRLMKEKRK